MLSTSRDDNDFDLFWADRGWMREYFDQCFMEDHVRINHFRNHYEVSIMVQKKLENRVGKEGQWLSHFDRF